MVSQLNQQRPTKRTQLHGQLMQIFVHIKITHINHSDTLHRAAYKRLCQVHIGTVCIREHQTFTKNNSLSVSIKYASMPNDKKNNLKMRKFRKNKSISRLTKVSQTEKNNAENYVYKKTFLTSLKIVLN